MRISVILMILVAFALAAATAFLAKRYLDRNQPSQMSSEMGDSIAAEKILVASRDIAVGTVLVGGDLKYESWPKALIPATALRRPTGDKTGAKLEGMVTKRSFAAGEPLTMSAVFSPEDSGVAAGILEPGMRAVSINVSPSSGVAGLAMPGDKVDVILVADFAKIVERNPRVNDQQILEKFAAETILEDIRILGIDQKISRTKGESPVLGKTVTLEMSPKQAEKLAAAGMLGQLSLSLRSFATPTKPEETGSTADIQASTVLGKIVRADSGLPRPAASEDKLPPRYAVKITRGGSTMPSAAGQ